MCSVRCILTKDYRVSWKIESDMGLGQHKDVYITTELNLFDAIMV